VERDDGEVVLEREMLRGRWEQLREKVMRVGAEGGQEDEERRPTLIF
jgi:hypothetical protein